MARKSQLLESRFTEFEGSAVSPLEVPPVASASHRLTSLSLFWRTFFLLALLLLGSIAAWLQTLRALEFEPRAVQTAQQLASQVNLSRAALVYADSIGRVALLKTMNTEEGLRIIPREANDQYVPFSGDTLSKEVTQELIKRLGKSTVIASRVNQQPGLWIGFDIAGDPYWLLTDLARFGPTTGKTWIIWLAVAGALSLCGAALIARLINRPLKKLSFAASRMREGDFGASRLDETVQTAEIRDVNIGFNRMAQSLAKVEHDRALMLAGISHDLRTPLARLRLETELSVSDLTARAHMAADIAQLDAIIDKFLDYARPDRVELARVSLISVVDSCVYSLRNQPDVNISVKVDRNLMVMADEVELGRIISNLLENARRYGKSSDSGIANIDIAAVASNNWVLVKIRDHGIGVAPDQLANLSKPFFRGETARTAANGAGLGLAIVEKTLQRMGGGFSLAISSMGGLSANFKLQQAPKV
ncbi:ATP-binding protein [Rhodoferax aquaticus]|uniref:histidine kinase n=1 Tax=Rhodoferax aquaticus TaxID=2527691 RepID=A0A515ENL5_9BURK|nr:ATP-binding protein [Rhodoferax aquaticus]QDL54261.1 HAMP domain-containing protein [Rhodoferax aquaticus]